MSPDDLIEWIVSAADRAECESLWRMHRDIWEPWHTGIVTLLLNE